MRQSGPGGKRRRAGFYSAIRREVPIRIFSIALKQFGLLPPAETTWQRPHWLADDTVLIEPVSRFKFPAKQGICREFLKILGSFANFRLHSASESIGLQPNSLRNGAGIF